VNVETYFNIENTELILKWTTHTPAKFIIFKILIWCNDIYQTFIYEFRFTSYQY